MKHEQITEQIIGCAFVVAKKMGYGFLEHVYENCMVIELQRCGLRVESQKPIEVKYDGLSVGEYIADLLIEDVVIVELKAVQKLAAIHEVQLVHYLQATGKEVGLLINFADATVECKRKHRDYKPPQTPPSNQSDRPTNPDS